MGSIHRPPVSNLALALAQAGKLKLFVETGTFQGDSLRWASQHFERVWTVEISAQYQEEAKAKVGALPNVEFVLGNSAEQLGRIYPSLTGPALFWLDAHAGAGFFGSDDNCPLLAELDACLVQAKADHCILIDDARAFVAPPPPPFRSPQMAEPGRSDRRGAAPGGYHVAVISDVMTVVPASLRIPGPAQDLGPEQGANDLPSRPTGSPRTGTRGASRPRRSRPQ